MEMNNSVFYKVNSNSSCFADIKLKRAFSKYTNFKTRGSSYFFMSNGTYFLGLLVLDKILHG